MVQPQKCFLHNVFSLRDTAEHAIRDRKDEAPEFRQFWRRMSGDELIGHF